MSDLKEDPDELTSDPRFERAVKLFNSCEWYLAHDAFEEIWHETNGPERRTLQGVLQIAVAQVHLERGNNKGAIVLYGEGLGRLRCIGTPDLGLDIERLCIYLEQRLIELRIGGENEGSSVPILCSKYQ